MFFVNFLLSVDMDGIQQTHNWLFVLEILEDVGDKEIIALNQLVKSNEISSSHMMLCRYDGAVWVLSAQIHSV